MNNLEKKMIDTLKRLKSDFNVVEIKAEFEAEATRLDEAIRLKEIVDTAGLGLIIKIGGAEAIRDMFDAQLLDVSGLVAPMIESSYALTKYLEAIEKFFPKETKTEINFGVNIETMTAFFNLGDILKTKGIERLTTITVGRVDLASSLGLSRNEINDQRVYEITASILRQSKKEGFRTTIGGGIAVEALPFITRLLENNIIDRYETRKVVFQVKDSLTKAPKGILLANEFELLWLENKRNYYSSIYQEDDQRISMLKKRLQLGYKRQLRNKKRHP